MSFDLWDFKSDFFLADIAEMLMKTVGQRI